MVLLFLPATIYATNISFTSPTPANGATTGPSVMLNAASTANAICEYMVDGGGWAVMNITGGTNHSQLLSGLSDGSHNVHVHCCIGNPGQGCGQAINNHIKWNVENPPAIPEYPLAVLPAILSVLGLGLVKMKK